MTEAPPLRRGWTTGACATAAVRAALSRLWGGAWSETVSITLPRGETPVFVIAHRAEESGWAEAGIIKDAGDDPDVTDRGTVTVAGVQARWTAGVTPEMCTIANVCFEDLPFASLSWERAPGPGRPGG